MLKSACINLDHWKLKLTADYKRDRWCCPICGPLNKWRLMDTNRLDERTLVFDVEGTWGWKGKRK